MTINLSLDALISTLQRHVDYVRTDSKAAEATSRLVGRQAN